MLLRKQLLLDDKLNLELLEIAREENRSFSDLAREALTEKVKEMKKMKKTKKRNAATVLLESARRIEKLGLGGPPDLSTNDEYIYG